MATNPPLKLLCNTLFFFRSLGSAKTSRITGVSRIVGPSRSTEKLLASSSRGRTHRMGHGSTVEK